MDTQEEVKGFFASLLDFSFTSFVTTKIIKVLYGLGILSAAIAALFVLGAGIASREVAGIVGGLIGAPLLFLVALLYLRVVLEVLIVVFRISENTAEIARRGRTT